MWVLSSGSYDGARGTPPIGAPNDVADGNGGRPECVAGGTVECI